MYERMYVIYILSYTFFAPRREKYRPVGAPRKGEGGSGGHCKYAYRNLHVQQGRLMSCKYNPLPGEVLLACRLSEHQQQELCTACAEAAREMHDVLGEAKALQHLGLGSAEAADEAMARAMGTVERALTPTHPVIADILLSRAHLQKQANNFPKVVFSTKLRLASFHVMHGVCADATQLLEELIYCCKRGQDLSQRSILGKMQLGYTIWFIFPGVYNYLQAVLAYLSRDSILKVYERCHLPPVNRLSA